MSTDTFQKIIKVFLILNLVIGWLFIYRYFRFFYLELDVVHHYLPFIAAVIFFISVALVLSFAHRWLFKKRIEILLASFVFVIILVVLDVSLTFVQKKQPRFVEHHYLNYAGSPTYNVQDGLNIHNSFGYRGPEIEQPKPKGRFRIVALGGSTTYTTQVENWREDYPRVLQQRLRDHYKYDDIEVVNAGLGGYSSWESLINLVFKALDLEPDMIIIHHGINDVSTRLVRPDSYKGDNSGARKQWEKTGCLNLFCSNIVSFVTGIVHSGLDIHPDTYAYTPDNRFNDALGMTPEEALGENMPTYYARNLRNMIAVAQEHDIDVLLTTWAYSHQDIFTAAHIQDAVAQTNNVTRSVADLKNVPLYDFAKEMPTDLALWANGAHLNAEGAKIKGDLFARYLIDSQSITKNINTLKKTYEKK